MEMRYGLEEEIGARNKVRIKDRHKLSAGGHQSFFQCAGFVSSPVCPANVLDVESELSIPFDILRHDIDSPIRGIIKDLYFQFLLGIDYAAGGIDQTPNDVQLVEHRKLHRNDRIGGQGFYCLGFPGPEFQVVVDHGEAVRSENRQDRERDDVADQNEFFHSRCFI